MMEDLEKLNAMLDDIHKFIDGDEDKRKEIWDAFTQFRLIYGNEWISKEILQIVNGSPREQQRMLGISSLQFHRGISELFSDLRGRILNQMYVHAIGCDYAPKIGEVINNINPLFDELGKIYSLVFDNKTTLDEIRNLMNSDAFREKAKQAVDTTKLLEEIKNEMEKNRQNLDKVSRQVGGVQKGVTMLLASDEINVTPSADEAAEWYGVTPRTIWNWMSGAVKCDDWPGNSAPMKVYRESAARYKAVHKKTDGTDDEGTWGPGSSMLDKNEINNGYSIK